MTARQTLLITGGTRSGKSQYAERRALEMGARRLYIATAEAQDEEMARRIEEHRKRRAGGWTTVEEPVDLAEALTAWRGRGDVALVDCLTLWISNLLLRGDEKYAGEKIDELLARLPHLDFSVLLVANEVGWGIVPDNPLARQFRDLAGRANQRIGAAADEVILMVAGIPMTVKPRP
jgi:adenosylcobinamide kinase/adenosylcobinamide-phosphate guanylyltransferase